MLSIWKWHPLVVASFTFAVDFGAIVLIRIITKRNSLLPRWWTFKVGDSVFLPAYAGFAAVIIHHMQLLLFTIKVGGTYQF